MRIREWLVPKEIVEKEGDREIFPFFILVTLVMIFVYVQIGLKAPAFTDNPLRLTLFSLLMVVHLALYWMIFPFLLAPGRIVLYLVIQGALAFTLVMLSAEISMAIALYGSLIGNAVGILGRNRMTVYAVLGYCVLIFVNLLLLSDMKTILNWLAIFAPVVGFTIFFAYLFNRQIEARARAQSLLEELEEAHRQLAEYTLQVEDLTRANERQRMARELHDTLAQGLAGLILQLEAVDSHLDSSRPERAQEIVQQAMSQARTTLADARRAINDLREEIEQADLVMALQVEARRFTQSTGIPCEVSPESSVELDEVRREHLHRIVAEGLTNIAQHARASHIAIHLRQDSGNLVLTIADDGIGFDPEKAEIVAGHYGLVGMRERVRLLGGTFTIASSLGDGTTLVIRVPLDSEGKEEN